MFCSIDTNLLSDMSRVQQLSVIPVLSLLESCAEDALLCHKTLNLLIQVQYQGFNPLTDEKLSKLTLTCLNQLTDLPGAKINRVNRLDRLPLKDDHLQSTSVVLLIETNHESSSKESCKSRSFCFSLVALFPNSTDLTLSIFLPVV